LIYSALIAWLALFLLFNELKNKKMIIIFLSLSIICFMVSFYFGFTIDFKKAFTVNQYLLTLLIGVSFLRLTANVKLDVNENNKGKKSFLKTYLGVHLFGSVINLSALILVADKLYKRNKLSDLQIIALTRAFGADAYWSPFFVAFAAVSVYAPHLDTKVIFTVGIFLAFIAFLLTYFEVSYDKKFTIKEFEGYPFLYLLSLFLLQFLCFFSRKIICLLIKL